MLDSVSYVRQINDSANFIRFRLGHDKMPEICIVLGSGLAPLADMCEIKHEILYTEIPNFPRSTAPGHEGKLLVGTLSGKNVFMFKGRFHYYEGYDISQVVFYVRAMARLGVKTIVLTNAAGGIGDDMHSAELMTITDHLSFFAEPALRGPNLDELGTRFPDQSEVYCKEYVTLLDECAKNLNISLHKGVYAYSKGPQYETPAEIRALKVMGASAVGMSTVPEAQTASHCGMKVAAISCISNMAAGISHMKLSEEEVFENAAKTSADMCALVKLFTERI